MRHLVALMSGLVLLWLILSGHYTPLVLALGGLSCVLVAWLCARLGLVSREAVPIALLPRLPLYTVWLLFQIARANMSVTWRLLAPRRFIKPGLVEVGLGQRSDLGRAIFANSVTLTPGTVTIGLENGRAMIHSLTPLADDDVTEGVMNRRVRWLESRHARAEP
ncbi:Na+/H+ antiporter subunit E [Salinisphaera sp. Q1T1-3]|uniref:Na+/H+ antiporter subunit E n=1 Tax=Salinisphaera sp. Q1T1-3 TaxID=2321229 RepID=UPI000E756680|nr:Na+/H+ antiporter subunit E [Salinisphaera sp. Q1T1-3]RJS93119.1 cation transporter [Salinisphaera sp. Q1T1-3]